VGRGCHVSRYNITCVLLLNFAKEAICRFSALPHSLIPPSRCELINSKQGKLVSVEFSKHSLLDKVDSCP